MRQIRSLQVLGATERHDKKIYFYRLILTDFAEKRPRDQEQ